MPNRVTYNNFSSGVISPEMRRMVNSEVYNSSASVMENVYPLDTGGFIIRDGLRIANHYMDISIKRIIPFCVSEKETYILAIAVTSSGATQGRLDRYDSKTIISTTLVFSMPYSEEDISSVRYAQNNEMLVLVHQKYPPFIVRRLYDDSESRISFSTANINLVYQQEYDKETINFNYEGLFTENNFPSVVTFISGRLWFANSTEHPNRMWASRPFDYFNFQDVQYYRIVEDTATVQQILDSISGDGKTVTYGTDKTETGNDITIVGETVEDSALYKLETETSTSTSGYRVVTKSLYEKKQITGDVETGKNYYWSFLKTVTNATEITDTTVASKWKTTITEDCAMILDVNADSDDAIQWIKESNYIYVGTSSSEYMMDKAINAQTASISRIANFGTAENMNAVVGNSAVMYVQSGRKGIRTISYGRYGAEYSELNIQCRHLFTSGIKSVHWQRTPYQRLYVLLNDGTCAVMCMTGTSGAWSLISVDGCTITDIAISDNENGQTVYAMVDGSFSTDTEGSIHSRIMRFEEEFYYDDFFNEPSYDFTIPNEEDADTMKSIKALVVSNALNSAGLLSTYKGAMQYYVDSMGTPFMISQDGVNQYEKYDDSVPAYDDELIKVNVYGRNTYNLRFRIKNMIGNPFRILAIESVVEVV